MFVPLAKVAAGPVPQVPGDVSDTLVCRMKPPTFGQDRTSELAVGWATASEIGGIVDLNRKFVTV